MYEVDFDQGYVIAQVPLDQILTGGCVIRTDHEIEISNQAVTLLKIAEEKYVILQGHTRVATFKSMDFEIANAIIYMAKETTSC